jgi:RNA polymerase sigma-70 factor (ECF subfamily)
METSTQINALLAAAAKGDALAQAEFLSVVHAELRRMAARCLRTERGDHTLQPTALINEMYLRLPDWQTLDLNSRGHFFAVASRLMRRVLVDYARKHNSEKRGRGLKCSLDEAIVFAPEKSREVLALDEALNALERLDHRQSRIVELRFFGGVSMDDIAELLNVSVATVKNDWALARVWLNRRISIEPSVHKTV